MADIKITDLTELTGVNVNSADLFEIVDFDVDTSKKVSIGGLTTYFNSNLSFATTAQGTLADSATQPGDNVSTLTNDAGYLTSISGLNISLLTNDSGYLTSISGLNISLLTNDSGYLTGITGQSIKNLSDVFSSMTPTDGQALIYDTTNGWQAETIASGLTDGTTPITSGTDADMFYNNGGVWTSMNSTNFYYDDTFSASAGAINARNIKTDSTMSFYVSTAQRMYLENGALWTDRQIIATAHITSNGSNGFTAKAWNTSLPIQTWQTSAGSTVMQVKTDGKVNMSALPTSSAGLSTGDLWNNSGVINIV